MDWCNREEKVQHARNAHKRKTTTITATTTTSAKEVKPMRTEYRRNGNWYAVREGSGKPEWAEAERQVPIGGRVRRANSLFA
jgi:hypothetical protein